MGHEFTRRLQDHFLETRPSNSLTERVGLEVETSFVDGNGGPVSVARSQQILKLLPWEVTQTKGRLVTEVTAPDGSRILYELGRQNIELSLAPYSADQMFGRAQELLDQIYRTAETLHAFPYFAPILSTREDLLVVPDERDAIWVELDGRPALNLLAKCSAVQFTVEVSSDTAVLYLSKLADKLLEFLVHYPQDKLWRQYIAQSAAGYRTDRYGGPLYFQSVEDYCLQLAQHELVGNGRLVSSNDQAADTINLDLFLRSIWWYFRLRRYGDRLCIEIRPLPRLKDLDLVQQWQMVLDFLT